MTVNSISNVQMSDVMMRLSSGQRINSASDDPAGLGIANRMEAQERGFQQGTRNVLDMQSLVNTAEAGLSSISGNLQRIRELTVQASNGILTDSDRQNIQFEIDALMTEIDDVSQRTEFNSMRLLDGSFSAEDNRGLHVSADPAGRGPTVSIGNMSSSMLMGPEPYNVVDSVRQANEATQISVGEVEIPPAPPEPPALVDIITGSGAPADEPEAGTVIPGEVTVTAFEPPGGDLLSRVDNALTQVAGQQSYLGAMSNRFDTTVASNQIANLNMAASRSRIQDQDMAMAVMELQQQQVLEQTQIQMQQIEQEQQEQQVMPMVAMLT